MQWPSTVSSVFDHDRTLTVLIDLMAKVYANHPSILLLCGKILEHGKIAMVRFTLVKSAVGST